MWGSRGGSQTFGVPHPLLGSPLTLEAEAVELGADVGDDPPRVLPLQPLQSGHQLGHHGGHGPREGLGRPRAEQPLGQNPPRAPPRLALPGDGDTRHGGCGGTGDTAQGGDMGGVWGTWGTQRTEDMGEGWEHMEGHGGDMGTWEHEGRGGQGHRGRGWGHGGHVGTWMGDWGHG